MCFRHSFSLLFSYLSLSHSCFCLCWFSTSMLKIALHPFFNWHHSSWYLPQSLYMYSRSFMFVHTYIQIYIYIYAYKYIILSVYIHWCRYCRFCRSFYRLFTFYIYIYYLMEFSFFSSHSCRLSNIPCIFAVIFTFLLSSAKKSRERKVYMNVWIILE